MGRRANHDLTESELATLDLLAWGETREEVAKALSISMSAVSDRSQTAFRKLGARCLIGAIREALSRGYKVGGFMLAPVEVEDGAQARAA